MGKTAILPKCYIKYQTSWSLKQYLTLNNYRSTLFYLNPGKETGMNQLEIGLQHPNNCF